MRRQRNALLLFCKPPTPGLVKTRLCRENGGPLTNEQAAGFFRASILDEADLAMLVFDLLESENAEERQNDPNATIKTYNLFVSTAPSSGLPLIRSVFEGEGEWERPIEYLCDSGPTFDHHFNDAFNQIFAMGYDSIVAVGGDMPLLPPSAIIEAFEWLEYLASEHSGLGFVMAPCQEAGTSIVGRTRRTPVPAEGIYYNALGRTVIDGYLEHLREHSIPFAFLDTVSDVDSSVDLAHLVSCLDAMADAYPYQPGMYLPRRVLAWADETMIRVVAAPSDERDPRSHLDVSTPFVLRR